MSAPAKSSGPSSPGASSTLDLDDIELWKEIQNALTKVKTGDAFMYGGLEEGDYHVVLQANDDGKLNTFFEYVAKCIVEGKEIKKKKKGRKYLTGVLMSNREHWRQEIQKLDASGDAADQPPAAMEPKDEPMDLDETKPPAMMEKKQQVDVSEPQEEQMDVEETKPPAKKGTKRKSDVSDLDSPDEEQMDVNETKPPAKTGKKRKTVTSESSSCDDEEAVMKKKIPKKKVKKQPKKAASAKKKKKGKKKVAMEATPEEMDEMRRKVKEEFDKEKAAILEEVPQAVQDMWGQVGFGKWCKQWLPCLFVGPYDVGPGTQARNDWMDMFENTEDRRDKMTQMVYWYGAKNTADFYSFLPKKSYKLYDAGVKAGCNKDDLRVQAKMEAGKKLTKKDQDVVRAYEELREDLAKAPQDRKRGESFIEDYQNDNYVEVLITGVDKTASDNDDNVVFDDELDSDDDEILSDDDDDLNSDSDLVSDEDELKSDKEIEEEPTPVKPKAKKRKKQPKKSDAGTKSAKKAKAPPNADKKRDEQANEDVMMDFGEDDISSKDDADDESLGSLPSESDEDDEDFVEATSKKPAKKTKAKSTSKASKGEKKTIQRSRSKPKKEPSESALRRREHKAFAENEKVFLPVIDMWKAAIDRKDTDKIEQGLEEVMKSVESMTAPFIEEYKISPLMKAMKGILREQNKDLSLYKALCAKLGEVHARKKPNVPEGFVPKKRKKDQKKKAAAKKVKIEAKETESAEREAKVPDSVSFSPNVKQERSSLGSVASRADAPMSSPSPKKEAKAPPQTAKATSQKSERKSFSLNRLFKPKPESSGEKPEDEESSERISVKKEVVKSLPSWLTKETSVDDVSPTEGVNEQVSQEIDRELALEFLQSAALRFPSEKVSRDAIARNLEAALFKWSRKEDDYWTKLHAIVAGICGKKEVGAMVAAIMAGQYATAKDVVQAPDEVIRCSFYCDEDKQ